MADRPLHAAVMATGAMALFVLIDNLMRLAAPQGGLWQFHLLRGMLAVALLLPVALVLRGRLRPRRPRWVLLRSFLNSGAMVIYFGGLGFLPIAQVVAGLFTAPVWVVLLGALVFGERPSPRALLAVALGLTGALLALRPDAGGLSAASLLPLLSGVLYGAGNLVTRRLCADEPPLALLGSFFAAMALWGGLGSLALSLWPQPVPEGAAGWPWRAWAAVDGAFLWMIVVQAAGSLLGVGLVIRAYQIAPAPQVAVIENLLLVFATLWAIVLWGEVPGALRWAGLALIVAAGLVTVAPGGRREAAA